MPTPPDQNDSNKQPQKSRRRRGTSLGANVDHVPRQSRKRALSEPDCIHQDEALMWSWEAMEESGGWR